MQSPVALVFRFFDWLQKKFDLKYVTVIIKVGGPAAGITDINWDQHFKRQDFKPVTREDFLREIQDIANLEKDLV